MSEKQVQAYLAARDVVRRLQRSGSSASPAPERVPTLRDRTQPTRPGEHASP